MENIIYAGQATPWQLLRKTFPNSEEKERRSRYLEIIQKYYPNYEKSDITRMVLDINKSGCATTSVANIIARKFYNEDSFKEQFGFDLKLSNSTIDYNILLVDLCCAVYKKAKIDIYSYERFSFDNVFEAARSFLGKEYDNDIDASNALYKEHIIPDGFDSDGKYQYKNSIPKKETIITTMEELALEKFGIENKFITEEELKSMFKVGGTDVNIADVAFFEKFSGLLATNKEFWINYYLEQHNLNYEVNIEMGKYDTKEFYQMLKDSLTDNSGIEISSDHNNPIYLHTDKRFSYFSLENDKGKGHAMTYKDIDFDGNIIVSSWGHDYIIDKEFIPNIEVSRFRFKEKTKNLEHSDTKKA